MSDDSPPQPNTALPEPTVRRHSGMSLVWLVPLITAVVGAWLIYHTLSEKGPRITVSFATAEGIEAGKTRVKYKNVDVGVVQEVRFDKGFGQVILSVDMERQAEPLLHRDTRFWVVRPRLGLRGVSGLSTLISGAYIEMEPGKGAAERHFSGLDSPPVIRAEDAGKKVVLMTHDLGSIDAGSPIYYQGIMAGEVLGYELGNDQRSVLVYGFIKAPFDQLVRGNTRFWNVSGVDVSMGADGFKLHTASVQSLLYGGIAFETPESLEPAAQDVQGLVYTLYDNHEKIAENAYTTKVKFVMFFDGSVRGLNIGAPVEFKGIRVGSVVDVRLEFDSKDTSFSIPVLVEIEPERIIERGGDIASPYQTLKKLVDRGLRGRLQTGNLLTGQLFVELDMRPDTPVRLVGTNGKLPELPTIPAELAEITNSVKGVLTKLNQVDFDAISHELEQTLHGTSVLVNAPELRGSVAETKRAMVAFGNILEKLDTRAGPIADNVAKAAAAGNLALGKLQTTLTSMNSVLRPDSPVQYRMVQMAEELADMARSVRTLVDLLERDPQSLLFGKNPPGGK